MNALSGFLAPLGAAMGVAPPQQQMAPQKPMSPVAQMTPRQEDSGLRRFLGNLGDAILTANGGEPIYQRSVERRQMGDMLAQYLGSGNGNEGLATIFREDPETGMMLYNAMREDKRFARTAGQDDRRIKQGDERLDLGYAELDERKEARQAGNSLTARGQDIQTRIAELRVQDAALDRAHRAALQQGDHQNAIALEQMRQANRLEIAQLGGSGGDYGKEVTTVEYPATTEGGFLGIGGERTPARTVRTERPLGPSGAQSLPPGVTQADVAFTAQKHGITEEEVIRRLGAN